MERKKGFTLIEPMVVIFIIGILAAVAIPIVRGQIDAAKWSEGKASMGSIRTAARAFCAEKGSNWGGVWANVTLADLGFLAADLNGKYFDFDDFAVAITAYDTYTVTATAGVGGTPADAPSSPSVITLNQDGTWIP